ncbi:hypothetical protein [Campylobacter volucris]|uniref:hypothetical protein n=1 Tax=Campylobacter volucris TaxID=1031542 RepID=UPI00189C6545|nr:hypothetical protein [Campylobacter volucris]MBF7048137.1 hypothetical protein [Campylobacter volucris]
MENTLNFILDLRIIVIFLIGMIIVILVIILDKKTNISILLIIYFFYCILCTIISRTPNNYIEILYEKGFSIEIYDKKTLGFGICEYNNYDGNVCKNYLSYVKKKQKEESMVSEIINTIIEDNKNYQKQIRENIKKLELND